MRISRFNSHELKSKCAKNSMPYRDTEEMSKALKDSCYRHARFAAIQIVNSGCFLNGTGVVSLAIFLEPIRLAPSLVAPDPLRFKMLRQ